MLSHSRFTFRLMLSQGGGEGKENEGRERCRGEGKEEWGRSKKWREGDGKRGEGGRK